MQLSTMFREAWLKFGGEQIAAEIDNITKRVSASWTTEHRPDDTHGAIHVISVQEDNRLLPMGKWQDVPFAAGLFTGLGAMTWTVSAANVKTFAYMMIGDTMWVNVYIDGTTVGGALNTTLQITLPDGWKAAQNVFCANFGFDNGVGTVTLTRVISTPGLTVPPATVIQILRSDVANWAASAGGTFVRVSMTFKVTK